MQSRRIVTIVTVAAALTLLLAASSTVAGPPVEEGKGLGKITLAGTVASRLNYQGRLVDPSTGNPVPDDGYSMVFTIYDAESDGNVKWTETQTVTVANGPFNVLLGSQTPLDASVFDGPDRWLQVEVGGETLSPRQRITSVAYAFVADTLSPGAEIRGTLPSPVLSITNSGASDGVHGTSVMTDTAGVMGGSEHGAGVSGWSHAGPDAPGGTAGVFGGAEDVDGVHGWSTNRFGVYGHSANGDGVGGESDTDGDGVWGRSKHGTGVYGWSDAGHDVDGTAGVSGGAEDVFGVHGYSTNSAGVFGHSANSNGVGGESDTDGSGVWGKSTDGSGVRGESTNGAGVEGWSKFGDGVRGKSGASDAAGVDGSNDGGGYGVTAASTGIILPGYDLNSKERRFYVDNDGDVYAEGSFHSGGADFAEMLPAADDLEPGDVLVIGPDGKLARSTTPYATNVAGVYSTQPGFVGGAGDGTDPAGKVPLAIVGVVPVKVTAESGSIRPGDLLTTSSIPGHAMKAIAPKMGAIIGKALASLESGTGLIPMLVIL